MAIVNAVEEFRLMKIDCDGVKMRGDCGCMKKKGEILLHFCHQKGKGSLSIDAIAETICHQLRGN